MNATAIKKMAIIEELSRLPETRLDTVKNYLDTLLMDVQALPPTNQSLKGIWKDAGFENLANLEEELSTVRQELQEAILKQKL
jgi:hypothetical protein